MTTVSLSLFFFFLYVPWNLDSLRFPVMKRRTGKFYHLMCDDDESRSLAAEPYAEETGKKKKKRSCAGIKRRTVRNKKKNLESWPFQELSWLF